MGMMLNRDATTMIAATTGYEVVSIEATGEARAVAAHRLSHRAHLHLRRRRASCRSASASSSTATNTPLPCQTAVRCQRQAASRAGIVWRQGFGIGHE